MVPPEPPTLSPDDLVGGRYRLTRRIARGGMAEVWEADDVILSRPVAVKALLPRLASDQAFVTRFRREAVAAARLSHPNIVAIYDTCSQPGCEAIVMELVRGRTLREMLDDHLGLPLASAVEIAVQVASALDHAHRHGLVHRDVKPGNILLGGDGRVLVADFGIAKALVTDTDVGADETGPGARTVAGQGLHHDLTAVGDVMGTAKYLAPEQVSGARIDARADVYALGVVLYEMLCGRPPFVGANPTATAVARLTDAPLRPRQVRAGIPRPLEEIVLHALARDPDARYQSASALRAALAALDLGFGAGDDLGGVDLTVLQDAGRTGSVGTGDPGGADPSLDTGDGYAGPERAWLVPAALIVVVATTLAVVGVLVGRTDVGRDLFESVGVGDGGDHAVAIASGSSFDPLGPDREENDDEVGFAFDDDPATGWRTEVYYRNPALGGLKAGVGIVLRLEDPAVLDRLVLTSPNRGWTGEVRLGDGDAADLAGWGEAVAEIGPDDTRTSSVEVDLGRRRAGAVLLWITDLGEERDGAYRFFLHEAALWG